MQQLFLLHNYNGKLFNDHFAIVQHHDSDLFFVGNEFELLLKSTPIGIVTVEAVITLSFKQITHVLAYLECGRPKHYLEEILRRQKTEITTPKTKIDHAVVSYAQRYYEAHTSLLTEWWTEHLETSYTER